MAFAFASLGYAKRLREAGLVQEQAEAHAEAVDGLVRADMSSGDPVADWVSRLTAQ